MSKFDVERYAGSHGEIAIRMGAPAANRILLALEMLSQERGLDPAIEELRDLITAALTTKSSGDTDSAPSSGE